MKTISIVIILLLFYSPKNSQKRYNNLMNRATKLILSEDYSSALDVMNEAFGIKNKFIKADEYNNALNCACLVKDTSYISKFSLEMFNLGICENYFNKYNKFCKDHITASIDFNSIKFRRNKKYKLFIDSLFNSDQHNRQFISIKEKNNRDSINLLVFSEFINKNQYPSTEKLGMFCYTSNGGINNTAMLTLQKHFTRFNNKNLNLIYDSAFNNFDLAIDDYILSSVENIKKYAASSFITNKNKLYFPRALKQNITLINNKRKKIGYLTLEDEYSLIKNQTKLLEMGFRTTFFAYQLDSEELIKNEFIEADSLFKY